MKYVKKIAAQFMIDATITDVSSYGSGNVNDTYLVSAESSVTNGRNFHKEAVDVEQDADRVTQRFILQRINQQVFQQPKLISLNLRYLCNHAKQRLAQESMNGLRAWCFPEIIPALDGNDYIIDSEGEFWRCQSFVEEAVTYPKILNELHAKEAGYALGRFHQIVSDLNPDQLYDTLEGFHITPRYLEVYDAVLQQTVRDLSKPDVKYGIDFIAARRASAMVLEDAAARGELLERAIHGDPKVDNILINTKTGKAVSIIDLDTVKPGLVQYDIGDCLRSCCNLLGEETTRFDEIYFDVDLCRTILAGYLPTIRGFFNEPDYAYLYDSVRLIAFELGLRFFTDYLNKNVYFKVEDDEHNLRRALVQFRLTESIEVQESQIRSIINELR